MKKLILILALLLGSTGFVYSQINNDSVNSDFPGGGGAGGLAASDINTLAELNDIVTPDLLGTTSSQTFSNKVIDCNINFCSILADADCTTFTDAIDGAYCYDRDDFALYICQTGDVCDDPGEWIAVGSAIDLPLAGGTLTGNLVIDDEKEIRLAEEDAGGANYIGFKAPATLASDLTLTWNIAPATCSGDGNGGALTINGSNEIICSADTGTGGAAINSFETWDAPAGTDPVADSETDTMLLAQGLGLSITGDSSADSLTWAIDYSLTLAGNPALGIKECVLTSEAGAGGLLCEGTTANTSEFEILIPLADPADTTNYFALGASDGDALAGDSATSFFDTGTIEDARLSTLVSLLGQTIGDAEVDDNITASSYLALAGGTMTGKFLEGIQAVTIADSGDGNPATDSATTIAKNIVKVDCQDADGCTYTIAETSAADGLVIAVENTSANLVTIPETASVVANCSSDDTAIAAGTILYYKYDTNVWTQQCGIANQLIVAGSQCNNPTEVMVGISANGNAVCEAAAVIAAADVTFDNTATEFLTDTVQEALEEVSPLLAGVTLQGSSSISIAEVSADVFEWALEFASHGVGDNVAMSVNTWVPAANGFLFEGTTADTAEYLLLSPLGNPSDTTNYFCLGDSSGNALGGDSATSFFTTGTFADALMPTSMADKTMTGAFIIPQGANPTCNTAGCVVNDTTADSIVYGANSVVIPNVQTKSIVVEEIIATDDNMLIGSWAVPVTITGIACHYNGSAPTLAATFTLEDGAGNAMTITGTNPTCAAPGSNATFAAVTAANTLVAGEALRFDTTNTPDPTTDTYEISIRYTYTRE